MPIFYENDTQTDHSPANPESDTSFALNFARPFVALPRLPHGIRELDVDKNADIRVQSSLDYFTKEDADCHITGLGETTLYSGVDDVFALAPADMDFSTGEYFRSTVVDPNGSTSERIDFDRPFVTPPKVVVFFNHIDLGKDKNWRLKTFATDIDVNGFTIHIESWSDTVFYAAQACWIAFPEDRLHIFSASVNTTEIRPVNQPQQQHSKEVNFGEIEFWKDPSTFVALNYIDIDCKANLRVNAHVDNVSRTGLTWHIDSWGDTVLYAAGASIIAFNA